MKIKGLFFIVGIMGLIVFNLSLIHNKSGSKDLSLKNISVMQASAVEGYCDQKTTSTCHAKVDGVDAYSTGSWILWN